MAPADTDQAARDALLHGIGELVDGQTSPVVVPVLLALLASCAEQFEAALRPAIVSQLRQLADEVELLDAVRH